MCVSLFPETTRKHADLKSIACFFLKKYIAVHVNHFSSKYDALMLMARKLCCFARGGCCEDNVDSVSHQELLLPGHILSAYTREKLEDALGQATSHIQRDFQSDGSSNNLGILLNCRKILNRYVATLGSKIGSLIASGNMISSSGLDLQQTTGFTVVAERLNKWRYLSHFRSVHRGQFFTTMKTTSVRKLLPESWGFLCPVHTPDGTPCGLLSHLTAKAQVVCLKNNGTAKGWRFVLLDILISLGMMPVENPLNKNEAKMGGCNFSGCQTCFKSPTDHLYILLDGTVLGSASDQLCAKISMVLRCFKVKVFCSLGIEATIEIAHIKRQGVHACSPFAGLYIFSQPARLVRPVVQCCGPPQIEMIGPFEQSTLQIRSDTSFARSDTSALVTETHAEVDPTNMLSALASLTPFSDFNQSPRNMYQCQMGKQTMGTPAHSLLHRSDNKLYRILTPQSSLVSTQDHPRSLKLDPFAQGTNSVVAVVAYTGYDMEDAMIVNKSAYERGFGHGAVYKSVLVDLNKELERRKLDSHATLTSSFRFGNSKLASFSTEKASSSSENSLYVTTLGKDGLPTVGQRIRPGEPLWCACSKDDNEYIIGIHKETEMAYVDAVRIIGYNGMQQEAPEYRVSLTLRFPRNPVIGDKFSSRHGQKGVLSVLWPESDMPFSESGFTPDLIINPHAFPSRMTIGMLVESMAGKCAALSGCTLDGTPFAFHEKIRLLDYLGSQLCAAGYQYYGAEPVYSGLSGLLMRVEIFVGVVYYQRLRHMVSDKSQVRGIGPVHPLTQQPVKGRKRHGGIRLGEMERDALLAHGVALLLHDRLVISSDGHSACICARPGCGEILSPGMKLVQRQGLGCYECNESVSDILSMPYVFRYLKDELTGMNVHVQLSCE